MFNLKKMAQTTPDVKLEMGTLISFSEKVYEIRDVKLEVEAFGRTHSIDLDLDPLALNQLQMDIYWAGNTTVFIEVQDSQMVKSEMKVRSSEQAMYLRAPTPEELAQYKKEVIARDGFDEFGNLVNEEGEPLVVEEII